MHVAWKLGQASKSRSICPSFSARDAGRPPRKQINASRSNINSIIETKRTGGVAGRSSPARGGRGCGGREGGNGERERESGGGGGYRATEERMRVDVSAGLRRMNEGRRVMLPRYCTARHERASQRGRPEGVVGFLFRPASFRPRAPERFDPFLPPPLPLPQTALRKLCCRCCIMCQGPRPGSLMLVHAPASRLWRVAGGFTSTNYGDVGFNRESHLLFIVEMCDLWVILCMKPLLYLL